MFLHLFLIGNKATSYRNSGSHVTPENLLNEQELETTHKKKVHNNYKLMIRLQTTAKKILVRSNEVKMEGCLAGSLGL